MSPTVLRKIAILLLVTALVVFLVGFAWPDPLLLWAPFPLALLGMGFVGWANAQSRAATGGREPPAK